MKKREESGNFAISFDKHGEKEVSEQIMDSYNIGVIDSPNHDPLQAEELH